MPCVLHMYCSCAAMWSELRMCMLSAKKVIASCVRVLLLLLLDSQCIPCNVS